MVHRLLVIDDEESFCEIFKINLETQGYDVDYALSAEQALEMDLSPYSLLIVDIDMYEINGFEFVRRIRQRLETSMLPVIFCSCHNEGEHKLTGFDVGADDYITKPLNLKQVYLRVRTVLNRCYPELIKDNY